MTNTHRGFRDIPKVIDGWIYVHHFHEPIGNDKQSAQHYTGWSPTPEQRIATERKGGPDAPKIMQALRAKGIDFDTVQLWPGNRTIESVLKTHSAKRMCPQCTPRAKTPKIIQAAIKQYERQQYRAARKADKAKKENTNMEKALMPQPEHSLGERFKQGSRAGGTFVQALMDSGKTADEIEEATNRLTAGAEPRDEKGRAELNGWNTQVESDLALLREEEQRYAERRHEATPIERTPEDEPYVRHLSAEADKQEDFSWLPDEYRQSELQPEYEQAEAG